MKKNKIYFVGIIGYKDKQLISIIFYCVKKFIVIEISGLVRIGLVRWVICFIRYWSLNIFWFQLQSSANLAFLLLLRAGSWTSCFSFWETNRILRLKWMQLWTTIWTTPTFIFMATRLGIVLKKLLDILRSIRFKLDTICQN